MWVIFYESVMEHMDDDYYDDDEEEEECAIPSLPRAKASSFPSFSSYLKEERKNINGRKKLRKKIMHELGKSTQTFITLKNVCW